MTVSKNRLRSDNASSAERLSELKATAREIGLKLKRAANAPRSPRARSPQIDPKQIDALVKVIDEIETAVATGQSHASRSKLRVFGVPGGSSQPLNFNLPGGSVSYDEDGVTFELDNGASVSVGKDGIGVKLTEDGDEFSVKPDGTVTVPDGGSAKIPFFPFPTGGETPSEGGVGIPIPSFQTTPISIPIPVPEFTPKTFQIPIPVPDFQGKPLTIPIPVPHFEGAPLSIPLSIPQFSLPQFNLPQFSPPSFSGFPNPFANFPQSPFQLPNFSGFNPFPDFNAHANLPFISALRQALQIWQHSCRFDRLMVNAVTAIGAPGCFTASDLAPVLRYQPVLAPLAGDKQKLANAAVEAVSKNAQLWAEKVIVPGLPLFPAFAFWPGPEAPPMPNVPFPMVLCPSSNLEYIVNPSRLETAIKDALPDSVDTESPDLQLPHLATAIAATFAEWITKFQIHNLYGRGPVPAFNPPTVPGGPVVNGVASTIP